MNGLTPQKICNSIRMEVDGVNTTNLPIDVFPQKVQEIILNLVQYENYKIEYIIASMLSAIATAIGNTYRLNVKGSWMCNPALYIILVGRAGMGKSHPMEFAYRPIREYDRMMYERYTAEMSEYSRLLSNKKDGETITSKPILTKTVISDFTTEAMVSIHRDNLRGIAIVIDEILALFKSINRYNNSDPLVEQLLSAYSNIPIDNSRKSEKIPIHISSPCINLIGSIQTPLLRDIFKKEYCDNGLLDRMLFVYPMDNTVSLWRIDNGEREFDTIGSWKSIVEKLLNEPLLTENGFITPHILKFSDEAKKNVYEWQNSILREVNAIRDDFLVESRKMKLTGNLARIALILQLLRWACGESHSEHVDITSVLGGIKLMEFFETCYARLKDVTVQEEVANVDNVWLSLLPDEFTTAEAIAAGEKLGMRERSIYAKLNHLSERKDSPIVKIKHGSYCKARQYAVSAVSAVSEEKQPEVTTHTAETAETAETAGGVNSNS